MPVKDLLEFIKQLRCSPEQAWLQDYYHSVLSSEVKPLAVVDVLLKSDELPLDFDETSENLRVAQGF